MELYTEAGYAYGSDRSCMRTELYAYLQCPLCQRMQIVHKIERPLQNIMFDEFVNATRYQYDIYQVCKSAIFIFIVISMHNYAQIQFKFGLSPRLYQTAVCINIKCNNAGRF